MLLGVIGRCDRAGFRSMVGVRAESKMFGKPKQVVDRRVVAERQAGRWQTQT
jgi:hypothetical protein